MTETIQQEAPQLPGHNQSLDEIQSFKGKYPKQIWALFFVEMWERFCFYGNRGMLTVFISTILLQKIGHVAKADAESQANLQYGAIQAFVYAFTFVGGVFADKILGFRKSLLWGGILMILGSFILGYDPEKFFYIGISFMVIGTGFFKPNISTMVGELYRPGDTRRDAGFGLFYSGINIGALFGGAACITLAIKYESWNWAFALSGIFMIIGLITFLITKKHLGPIGAQPEAIAKHPRKNLFEILVYGGSLLSIPLILTMVSNTKYTDLFMYIIGPATLIYLFWEMRKYSSVERQKLTAALLFIFFSIFFWAFFEQSGGSLALFASENLHDNLFGISFDPMVVNNSSNSFFIIVLSPFVGLLWVALAKRKSEPNAAVKFGLGFLFVAAAFFLFFYTKNFADGAGKTSLEIFAFATLVISVGELCLSPIGLSLMTKLSPKNMFGLMMGMWFLASAYGQYFAGLLGADMSKSGAYKVAQAPTPNIPLSTTITWKDTSSVNAGYKEVDLVLRTVQSDTLKTPWEKAGSEHILIKRNAAGDTVGLIAAGTPNDGTEPVIAPASLLARQDLSIEVRATLTEKLRAYTTGYKGLAIYALIAGLVLLLISPLIKKLMHEVK